MTASKPTGSEQSSSGAAKRKNSASANGGLAGFLILLAIVLIGGHRLLSTADDPTRIVDYYKIGSVVSTTADFYACEELSDLDKIKSFIAAKDNVAAVRYAEQSNCNPFQAGLQAGVESESVWHASICLRPYGETACRWFPAILVHGSASQKIGG